ncbi:MAG: heavy-metal-associated domain-containing protein [Mucilaginibacter polytrichastri]|nr:heavy-metal-associated domain-containing protein [Mucilaginibacter polytrichastri]
MKFLKITLAIIALFYTTNTFAQFTSAELQVSGLTCSMCSKATEKSLRTLSFIQNIKPDLNRNLFVISFKKNAAVQLDQIKKKVEDAGFSVSNLQATFDFKNVAVKDNFHYNYGGSLYHFMQVDNRTLNGPVKLTLLDKNFVPGKKFSALASKSASAYPCFKTGKMDGMRVYHVTI